MVIRMLLKLVNGLMAIVTSLMPVAVQAVAVTAAVGTTIAVTAGCAASDNDDDDDDEDDGGDDD